MNFWTLEKLIYIKFTKTRLPIDARLQDEDRHTGGRKKAKLDGLDKAWFRKSNGLELWLKKGPNLTCQIDKGL